MSNFMNTKCNRIASQLAATVNGDAWYGDSLHKILDGITAQQAQARPIPKAHSIWELVHHLEAWVKLAHGALQGQPIPAWPGMPKEVDWPPVTETSEPAWQEASRSLFDTHLKFIEAIKGFGDERLDSVVPGRAYKFSRLFKGLTQHAVYHSGQIALLKKS